MTLSVTEALRRRRMSGPPFDDGYRIALVAEGGAMRGVFAGGMVSAIEAEDFADCFDLMIGTSAGACALAYLRAGQARSGTRMFYEDLNTGTFIRPRRVLSGGPLISIDYLVDKVFDGIKQLDFPQLQRPGAALHATATDIDTAESVLLTGFEDPARALEILRATARMPLLSGGPVALDGRQLLDGGLLARVPVRRAIEMGATHVLVILTQRADNPALRTPPMGDRLLGYPVLSMRHGRQLTERIRAERADYERFYADLSPTGESRIGEALIHAVTPGRDAPKIGRTTQSGEVLRAGARHAEQRMRTALLEA